MNVSTLLYIHPHVDEWFKKTTLLRNDNWQTYSDLFTSVSKTCIKEPKRSMSQRELLYNLCAQSNL